MENLNLTTQNKILKSQRISSLDGLRGLAAIFVLLSHLTRLDVNLIKSVKFTEWGIGRAGVYLFFVLSSFLLTSQFLKPHVNFSSLILWKTYFKKRFLRIYPLYIVILIGYLIFWGYTLNKFLNHLFLIEGESCFWTIVVEIKYYFFLPIIVIIMNKVLKKDNFLFLFICFIIYLLGMIVWLIKGTISTISILPYLLTFMLGSYAALVNCQLSNSLLIKRNEFKWGLDFVALISIVSIFWVSWFFKDYEVIDSNSYFNWLQFSIPGIYGILWSIFLISHLWGKGLWRTILNNSLLRFIGTISFGIYLWHIPVLGYIESNFNLSEELKFIATVMITIIVSCWTYFSIEQPFILLGKKNPNFKNI